MNKEFRKVRQLLACFKPVRRFQGGSQAPKAAR